MAQTTPSQPYRDSGRPSTSTSSSSICARSPFSTLTSLSAHDSDDRARRRTRRVTSRVSRSSTVYVPRDHVAHRAVQVVDLGLGEEADLAEVDAEQRRLRRPGQLGGAQEGAVAAEREDDLRALGGRRPGRPAPRRAGPGRRPPRRPPAPRSRPRSGPRATVRACSVLRRRPVWVTSSAVRLTGHLLPSLRSRPPHRRTRSSPAARPGATIRRTRRCRWPGQRAGRHAGHPEPEPGAPPRPRRAPPRPAAPGRAPRRPDPTRSLPTSNCGLTISTRSPSGPVQAASAGSTSRSEMNDRSATVSVDRAADRLRGQRTHVGALEDPHPRSVRSDQASWP